MIRILSACVAVFMCSAAARIEAATVKNLSTGYDEANQTKVTNDSGDADYIIGPGSSGGWAGTTPVARSSPLPYQYITDSASDNSRWLVIFASGTSMDITVAVGAYFFGTQVDLTGFVPTTAQLTGLRYAADNKLVGIYINGNSVWQQSDSFGEDFYEFHSIADLGLGFFQPGLNTIRWEVLNQGSYPTAMALRLEGAVSAQATPEPSTLAIFTIGVITLFGYCWRKRAK